MTAPIAIIMPNGAQNIRAINIMGMAITIYIIFSDVVISSSIR